MKKSVSSFRFLRVNLLVSWGTSICISRLKGVPRTPSVPFLGLVVGLAVLLGGCLEIPVPPSWDTTVNLPLASRKIMVRDFVDDTLFPDSIALLKEGHKIDTIWVGDKLRIDSFFRDSMFTVRDLIVDVRYTGEDTHKLGQLFPELIPFHDSVIDVPPMNYLVYDDVVLSNDFTKLQVDSGYFKVGVLNGLGLRIDSLNMTIYNTMAPPDTFMVGFTDIEVGEYQENVRNISGKYFDNCIAYETAGWTHESTGVLIDTGRYLRLDGELFVRNLRTIIGKFPACTNSVDFRISLAPWKIELAVVDTGTVGFKLYNPLKCEFDLGLLSDECSALPIWAHIGWGYNDSMLVLDSDTLEPVDPESLRLEIKLLSGGSDIIDTVDDLDTFSLRVELKNLVLQRFKGFIDSVITIELPEYGKKIDYGGYDPTGISFDSVWLYYDIWNEIEAQPEVNLVVGGVRQNNWKYLNFLIQIDSGETYGEIAGDTITDFMNFWPESITAGGEVRMWGPIDICQGDRVWGEFGLMVPMDFILDDTLVFEPKEIVGIDVPSEVRKAEILETSLLVWYQNTTPLKGDVWLYVSNDSLHMESPIVAIWFREGVMERWWDVELVELLKSDRLWAKVRVRVFPAEVRIFVWDRLWIKTLLRVKLRVGK